MNSKVVKGLFLMTILGLVGLLAVTGAAVAWAAQRADDMPHMTNMSLGDAPAYDMSGQMMGNMGQMGAMGQMGNMGQMGVMGRPGHHGPEGGIAQGAMREEMHAALADALGVTVDELETAMAEGKSPMQLAEELGVDPAVLDEARQAVFAEALEAAVADGRLTQEQADLMTERQELMQQHRQEMRQWAAENADVLEEGQTLREQHQEAMRQWAEDNDLPAQGMMGRRGMRGGGMGQGMGYGMGQNRP